MDERAVERAAERYRVALPRSALGGRVGSVSSAQVGSSLELHDFREYQPGDDLRHIDWNAVARTDRLVLRVRREEVAPRVEILVDSTRSMAVSEAKRERARELAALFARAAQGQGLTPALHWLSNRPRRVDSPASDFEASGPLLSLLHRAQLRTSGVRILISDLLTEEPAAPLFSLLARGVALLGLVQVLSREDEDPEGGGARLVDSESSEAADRLITADALERYHQRLRSHLDALETAARRVRGVLCTVSASEGLEENVRRSLAGKLLVPRGAA